MGPRAAKARSTATRFRDAGMCFMVSIYTYLFGPSQQKPGVREENVTYRRRGGDKALRKRMEEAASVRRIDNVELLVGWPGTKAPDIGVEGFAQVVGAWSGKRLGDRVAQGGERGCRHHDRIAAAGVGRLHDGRNPGTVVA